MNNSRESENKLLVVPTSDGSNTLLHTGLNQTYHSVNGALQEARHVFLQNGLLYFLRQNGAAAASILEAGFGTGLNFLVSAAHCLQHSVELNYTGIEPFPVPTEILKKSAYQELFPERSLWNDFIARYAANVRLRKSSVHPEFLNSSAGSPGAVRLQLIKKPILETGPLSPADVIYFDAFAPATQPEMWTQEVIAHTVSSVKSGGVFVSYSITGHLKRTLKELGFRIEKPKGAAGKTEMIRAVKE